MTNSLNLSRSRNREWSAAYVLSDFQRQRLLWNREVPEAEVYSFIRGGHTAHIKNERVCVQYHTIGLSQDRQTYSWTSVVDFGICDDDESLRLIMKEYASQNLFKDDLEWQRRWMTIYIDTSIISVRKYIFRSTLEFFKLFG